MSVENIHWIKSLVDWTAVTTLLGTVASFLPPIASLFTILWLAIRMWETDTVKGWTGRK